MCGSWQGGLLNAGTDAAGAVESVADTIASVGGSLINEAGDIVNSAGDVISGAGLNVNEQLQAAGSKFGLKPLGAGFGLPLITTPSAGATDVVGDILEAGRQEFLDPITEGVLEPIVSTPFNTALGLTEDLSVGVLGPAASSLGAAGGFYPSSDQLGGIPSPVEEAASGPVQAVFDPRGADFLRDPRDRRYLNSRNTLLTGSQGVTGTPRTKRQNIFGNVLNSNRLGG